ncbi:MAG: hypothetical protein ACW99J_16920 [Candidatus Thorarchaeota archaeon]
MSDDRAIRLLFTFSETDPSETLLEAQTILRAMVDVEVAQYKISSIESFDASLFKDRSNYASFFEQFGRYANQNWERRTGHKWDFARTQFSTLRERIDGLVRILRTGGAYSEGQGQDEALSIERDFRMRLQGDSHDLAIICVANYGFDIREIDTGYTVDLNDLGEVSSFFNQLAWDDLVYVINTTHMMMYVIAFTDED